MILLLGASGYLGQILAQNLRDHQALLVYGSRDIQRLSENFKSAQVDLTVDESLESIFDQYGPFASVINTAALSQPAECQRDPEKARAVNVPKALLRCLSKQKAERNVTALLIHISTDQVYDGSKSFWRESDECAPINVYGCTKRDGEIAIQDSWPHHVILRSSIIYGPEPPSPVPRPLFLQWMDGVLRDESKTDISFFEDEWRSPTFVLDIARVVRRLLEMHDSEQRLPCGVLNMGGPERLSRLDMARQVAAYRGFAASRARPGSTAEAARPVASPQDISMCSAKLHDALGVPFSTFKQALPQILGDNP